MKIFLSLWLVSFFYIAYGVETIQEAFGVQGENVTLPCPHATEDTITEGFTWFEKASFKQLIYHKESGELIFGHDNNGKYTLEGTSLVIHNLDRRTDQKVYICNTLETSTKSDVDLVVYEPPEGISLQSTGNQGTVTFTCATIGGSKPPVVMDFEWLDKDNKQRTIAEGVERKESTLDEADYRNSKIQVTLDMGKENAFDTITCKARNEKTDTVFTEGKTLLPPSVAHGTPLDFDWLDEEITSITYASQVAEDHKQKGLVRLSMSPVKSIYYTNETVLLSIDQVNGDVFPVLDYKWYTKKNSLYAQLPKTGDTLEYIARENATLYCLISNLLGKVVISVKVDVKEGSSYLDLQTETGTASVSPVMIGVIVAVLAFIILMIVIALFVTRRRNHKKMDKYDVKKNTEDYDRDIELQEAAKNNHVGVEDEVKMVPKYNKPEPMIHVETESLMKSAVDDSGSHGDNDGASHSYKYEPQSSCEMTSRDGYSTGDDHGYHGGVDDDVSMKSGSTICIDDETFPLPPADDHEFSDSDHGRSYTDSQRLSGAD